MKNLLLILILILPFTVHAADAPLFISTYVSKIKNVKNAKEAMIYFNNEKALASQALNVSEPSHQTYVKELPNGTFNVRFIFRKRKDK